MTTCYPLSPKADSRVAIRKIQDKLFTYGIISPREEEYLKEHSGKIDQKKAFS
jgi:hypothetical protein